MFVALDDPLITHLTHLHTLILFIYLFILIPFFSLFFFFYIFFSMEGSRSNSVPLLQQHIDELTSDSNTAKRLTRSSFSLSSIVQQQKQQKSDSEDLWHNTTTEAPLHVTEDIMTISSSSNSSNSSDDEIIPMNTTNQDTTAPMLDLSSDILYEDIWIDSPVFHEYLNSLEIWLYHYLTWLEKIEQCRQLEVAYSKSIALLYEQTKIMLNEPFYTPEEVGNICWSSLEEEGENMHIQSILRGYFMKV